MENNYFIINSILPNNFICFQDKGCGISKDIRENLFVFQPENDNFNHDGAGKCSDTIQGTYLRLKDCMGNFK